MLNFVWKTVTRSPHHTFTNFSGKSMDQKISMYMSEFVTIIEKRF